MSGLEMDIDQEGEPISRLEDLQNDNQDDIEIFAKMSKELEVSSNIVMSKKNFLLSKIIVRSADAAETPVEDMDTFLQSSCVTVLGGDYVKTQVYGQAINKLADKQPTLGQLDTAILNNVMGSLTHLSLLVPKINKASEELNAKLEKRRELTKKYRELTEAFKERLNQDSETRTRQSDKPTLEDFEKNEKAAKKCRRITMLRVIITLLVSRSNINFLKNPELVALLKKCHKPFSVEELLEKLRRGELEEE